VLRYTRGFLAPEPREPELRLLHGWLDTWSGIGHVVAGMARQAYDLELRRSDGRGWRALFFAEGFEPSLTSYAGRRLVTHSVECGAAGGQGHAREA
jgi:hypothetical protein